MKKRILSFLVMTLLFFLSVALGVTESALLKEGEIKYDKHLKRCNYNGGLGFVVNFSNIIYTGKYNQEIREVAIPIFRGTMEDVSYKVLKSYLQSTYLKRDKHGEEQGKRESGYMVECKKGEVMKTLREFLAFYSKNIFKGIKIEQQVVVYRSPTDWILQYNFIKNKIPCYMQIEFEAKREDLGKPFPQSVWEIEPEENGEHPFILYTIYINSKARPVKLSK